MKSCAKCNKFQMLRSHTSIALIGCKYTKVFLITGNYAIFFKDTKTKSRIPKPKILPWVPALY